MPGSLTRLLEERIAREGPVSFSSFMETALYHPHHGYYRRGADPFGRQGDFYTASQLQPVFGALIAERIRQLLSAPAEPLPPSVLELGAGRAEMAEAFQGFSYQPFDWSASELPDRFSGVLFANEFFDALPVIAARYRQGEYREMRVGLSGAGSLVRVPETHRFAWVENGPLSEESAAYLDVNEAPREEGFQVEVPLNALRWIDRISAVVDRGFLFVIDYGYTAREWIRHPNGTLMSYRRHTAMEDVLRDPGAQDITAHVCFTALERHAANLGWRRLTYESMAVTLLAAGEPDGFAAALQAETESGRVQRVLQLKTLLYGMGETFRTLILEKAP